jgi:hypothetical protein
MTFEFARYLDSGSVLLMAVLWPFPVELLVDFVSCVLKSLLSVHNGNPVHGDPIREALPANARALAEV